MTSSLPPRDDRPGPSASELGDDALEFSLLDSAEITDEIAAEMLALYRAGFEQWPFVEPEVSHLDYLRWKISCPATQLGSYQIRLGGRLVYSTVAFANWFRIKGARRLQVTFLDACVAPLAQGQGIFSRAVAYYSTMRYRCDFSIHERVAAMKVRRGMAGHGQRLFGNQVRVMSRILTPSGPPTPEVGVRRLGVVAASFVGWAWGSTSSAIRHRPAAQPPRDVTRIDERFDALFERAAVSFDLIGERTAEFLSWRYGDRRGGRYFLREVSVGEELVGYFAMRIAGPRAYLTDLLVLPGREDAVEPLVVDAVALATASGASMIDCWLPRRHPYRAAFRRHGFFDRGDTGVTFHAVEMPAEELAPLEAPRTRIHYTLGDTDVV